MKWEERLVCVYGLNKRKNVLRADRLALAKYNDTTGEFIIKKGFYAGKDDNSFNLISGSIEIMNGSGTPLLIEDNKDKDYGIYIFDNRDINNIQKNMNLSRFETYKYIADHILLTDLIPTDGNLLSNSYESRLVSEPISNQLLVDTRKLYRELYGQEMFYQTEYDDNEESINNQSNLMVYRIDPLTGKLMRPTKEDLYNALPESILTAQEMPKIKNYKKLK